MSTTELLLVGVGAEMDSAGVQEVGGQALGSELPSFRVGVIVPFYRWRK